MTTFAEGEAVNPEFLASRNYPTARDLLSAAVVSIAEETSLGEIAELLTARPHIPVVQGRM